ncbi:MAG: hypothetical protein GVY18_12665 [Bacteroidetes bacterium]|nr:hypothetical protein [Bacteroidota bacterium]
MSTLACFVALLLYGVTWMNAPLSTSDTPSYQAVGADLADGSLDALHLRAPGYGLFLLATGSHKDLGRPLFWATLVVYLCAVLLLTDIARRKGLPDRYAYAIPGLLLLPPFIDSTAYALSEALTGFLLALALWLFVLARDRRLLYIACGLVLGAAGLVRPTYQLAFIVFALPLAVKGQWRASALLSASFVLIVGGYCLLNYAKFDYFGVTPALGLNLSTQTVPLIDQLPESQIKSILIDVRDKDLVEGTSKTGKMYIWRAYPRLVEQTGLGLAELSAKMQDINLSLIVQNPLTYLKEVGEAFVIYWFPTVTRPSMMGSGFLKLLWTALHFAFILLFGITLIVFLGSFLLKPGYAWSSLPPVYFVMLLTIFYTALISCLVEVGNPRYRVPTDGFIVLVILFGVDYWQKTRERLA